MNFKNVKSFTSGVVVTALVMGGSSAVMAKVAKMDIPVSFNNIKVIVDGKELKTDKEPFIYEGTTYLPVRAVAEAVGKEVAWDGETQTVTLGAQTSTEGKTEETVKSYSRSNPVPIGVDQTVSVDTYSDKYTAEIKFVNIERGSSAWTKILAKNQFNSPAPDGKEYVLAYVRATVKSVDGDKAVDFSSYNFTPFSGKDSEYKSVSVVKPEPEFRGQAYKDGTVEGYMVFLVDTNDANPKVSFGAKYDGTGGMWFKLSK